MEIGTDYIDQSLRALTTLRDVLTPAGIQILQIDEVVDDPLHQRVGVTISVQLPRIIEPKPDQPPHS